MTNFTQGKNSLETPRGVLRLLVGSAPFSTHRFIRFARLGIILSTTALPPWRTSSRPARLGIGTTTTIAATTTTTSPHDDHDRASRYARRQGRRCPPLARRGSYSNRNSRPASTAPSPTTTTPPPTTVVTPRRRPHDNHDDKDPPVTKAPALSISNPSANIAPSPDFLAPVRVHSRRPLELRQSVRRRNRHCSLVARLYQWRRVHQLHPAGDQ